MEHLGIEVTFGLRQRSFCIQGGKFQLQEFVFGDLPHFTFSKCYFVEVVGIGEVLPGCPQVFFGQQEIKIIGDCPHGYFFGSGNKSSFCFRITYRFNAPVPFHVVYAKNRLREFQRNGNRSDGRLRSPTASYSRAKTPMKVYRR